MSNKRRLEKVSALLKKEITLILMNDLVEKFYKYIFVSITNIELSGDLQFCKIYVKSGDNDQINELVKDLNLSRNTIRHLLSQRIDMRRTPEIVFKEDKLLEKGLNVLKILDEIRETDPQQIVSLEDDNV